MPELIETLARELESPRAVSPQVSRHIGANYGVADDAIGPFLRDTLPALEEDEVDLVLSPLFTPRLADQAVFADLLGRQSVPPGEQARLVEAVVARPTVAALVTADDQTHRVRLSEVTVERYVYRLRLEATISESVAGLIDRFPRSDRAMLRAIARRAIWERSGRSSILEACLTAIDGHEEFGVADVQALLDIVERYKPDDAGEMAARMPLWAEGLRSDLTASGSKPFFNELIERSHGGERDRRSPEDALMNAKRRDLTFLERLAPLLAKPVDERRG